MHNRTETKSPRLLSPLSNGDNASCGPSSSSSSKPSDPSWSKYHTGCVLKQSLFLDWSSKKDKKKTGAETESRPVKSRSLVSFKDAEENEITNYLKNNKEFLDAYVLQHVSNETLNRWIHMKNETDASSADQQLLNIKKGASGKDIFMDMFKKLKAEPNEHDIPFEMAASTSTFIGADAYRIFKLFPDHPNFVQYFITDGSKQQPSILVRAEPEKVALVLEVAQLGSCVRVSKHEGLEKFPATPRDLFKDFLEEDVAQECFIMYIPILNNVGKTTYVIEMWRNHPYTEEECEICNTLMVWSSLALHYCNMYLDKKRERNMSDFLLDVVKAIFEEMVSLDQLIKRILEFAQRLVNADRASLFLVDYRNYELVSTVFDLKFEPGLERDLEKKEIRMPINRGIAGHVALSGETMNIPDAYSDYRFNREVDEATGYKTISILCMPIKVEGRVIGVVQMVNKRNDDNFDHDDEVSFEIFSTFFGLALHHARLYDRIMRKEQKYRVALEVLSYHNTCRENEVQAMLGDKENLEVDLNDFYLDPFSFDEFKKCKCVVVMFNDLFGLSNFDVTTITRFILTVKKNYRTVPYHNFDHGWSVAHAMYVILKNDHRKRFDYKMRLALFVACLCHDLDHRGYTNKYMSETASPLAAMYTTSTLEHHHFNITVTILQQDGHNIFSHISSEDYKEILGLIRQCILATDLAAFFPNLAKMKEVCGGESAQKFSWAVPGHRDLAMAISMTAADLSASAKPWAIQIKTVKVIFEEFYDQGDKERAAGRVPIPMMDRNKPEERPASQVGFLSQICIPCYTMLHKILPNTKPMLTMAVKNLDRWQARADKIVKKMKRELKDRALEGLDQNERTSEESVEKPELKVPEVPEANSTNSSISWEEDDEIIIDKKVLNSGGMKKEQDIVSWIEDDEDVVVAKEALKAICESGEKSQN